MTPELVEIGLGTNAVVIWGLRNFEDFQEESQRPPSLPSYAGPSESRAVDLFPNNQKPEPSGVAALGTADLRITINALDTDSCGDRSGRNSRRGFLILASNRKKGTEQRFGPDRAHLVGVPEQVVYPIRGVFSPNGLTRNRHEDRPLEFGTWGGSLRKTPPTAVHDGLGGARVLFHKIRACGWRDNPDPDPDLSHDQTSEKFRTTRTKIQRDPG
ncbi:hypothetical protein K438DRAFT_1750251 [Mycena galopus ATCC 62051]|nr:hypothetical protein K438DRAFT_1750251 [Mycena galopus ATCC 62051]